MDLPLVTTTPYTLHTTGIRGQCTSEMSWATSVIWADEHKTLKCPHVMYCVTVWLCSPHYTLHTTRVSVQKLRHLSWCCEHYTTRLHYRLDCAWLQSFGLAGNVWLCSPHYALHTTGTVKRDSATYLWTLHYQTTAMFSNRTGYFVRSESFIPGDSYTWMTSIWFNFKMTTSITFLGKSVYFILAVHAITED